MVPLSGLWGGEEMENDKLGVEDYQLKYWVPLFGAKPVERIYHFNYTNAYEICEAHVFILENGKFAFVLEEGCSDYSSEDAQIDILPTRELAEEKFRTWVREQKRMHFEREDKLDGLQEPEQGEDASIEGSDTSE